MPCVYEAGGRHHRSHVHVVKGGASAVFALDGGMECLGNNGFRAQALMLIAGVVGHYQEIFLEKWSELNDEE